MNNKYTYIPSYIFKTGSKYQQLTNTYQPIFEKYISKEALSIEENKNFFIGIKHCVDYIIAGFFYSVKENFDSKSNQEKIISSIYNRLVKVYEGDIQLKDKIKTHLIDLAENALFYTLGIESYKKRNYIWSKNSYYKNIIKHASEVVFKSLVFDYLQEQSSMLNLSKVVLSEEYITEEVNEKFNLTVEDMIKESGLENFLPRETKEKLIIYLTEGEESYYKELESTLKYMYQKLKEKNII